MNIVCQHTLSIAHYDEAKGECTESTDYPVRKIVLHNEPFEPCYLELEEEADIPLGEAVLGEFNLVIEIIAREGNRCSFWALSSF